MPGSARGQSAAGCGKYSVQLWQSERDIHVLIHGKKDESYNIGTEYETTIREMAEYYAKIGCVKLTVLDPSKEERKAFNPMDNATLDINKIKEIGYIDHFSAEEGFFHTVEIIKELYH